jgi:fructose-1-phosphate kinase PfkB-like protein
MTELVENGRPLSPEELDAYRQAYAEEAAKASILVLTGSLPTGTPGSYYRELLERTPCPAVLDFRGEGLAACLDLKPLVIKPNREELGHTIGHAIENDAELLDAMRSLNRRGAQWVVITQGGGPVWLTSATETYRLKPFPVDNIVTPIGCGDSMAAGIAWAIRDGRSMVDAVRFGMAAAAQNARRLDTGRIAAGMASQEAEKISVHQPWRGGLPPSALPTKESVLGVTGSVSAVQSGGSSTRAKPLPHFLDGP